MVKKIIFALSLLTAGAPYAAAQSQGKLSMLLLPMMASQ